ncbi:MAG: hypothetical protein HKM04_01045 [Legionellales bacterium]|nr:hypothetical protein [Legionellales bacterium]
MSIRRLDHVNFITHDMPATKDFYCNIIGLVQGDNLSIDTAKSAYFYIEGQDYAVLHIGDAKGDKKQPKFRRFAELPENHNGTFSTGAADHFCLALDQDDYQPMIEKLKLRQVNYQTYCHQDISLKQIWLFDPNGVRVELNFINFPPK